MTTSRCHTHTHTPPQTQPVSVQLSSPAVCFVYSMCVCPSVCVRVDLALFQIYSHHAPQSRCESMTGM